MDFEKNFDKQRDTLGDLETGRSEEINENAETNAEEAGSKKSEVNFAKNSDEMMERKEWEESENMTGVEGFDLGRSSWSERLRCETLLNSLSPEHRLCASKNKPMSLGEFLCRNYNMRRENIVGAYVVVVDDEASKSARRLDTPADYDLMSDVVEFENGKYRRRPNVRNIIINVELVNESASRLIINLDGLGWMDENPWMLMALSIMSVYPDRPSNYEVRYFMFEEREDKGVVEKIAEIAESARRKLKSGEPLTPEEKRVVDVRKFERDKQMFDIMFSTESYGTAVSIMKRWFTRLKSDLDKDVDNQELREKLRSLSFDLAEHCLRLGLYNKALYYGEYGYALCPEKNDIGDAEFIVTLMHAAKDPRRLSFRQHGIYCKSWFNHVLPLSGNGRGFGTILHPCFDIFPSELNQLFLVKDRDLGRVESISSQWDIWRFDFISRMTDCNEMTAYISYRSMDGDIDDDLRFDRDPENDWDAVNFHTIPMGTPDCSIERINNVVVVNFKKMILDDRRCVTMEVMMPGFVQLDLGRGISGDSFVFAERDYLDRPLFEEIRKEAECKMAHGEELSELESKL